MDYITGANKFLLSEKEISALKEKVSIKGDDKAAYRLYEYYQYYESDEEESIKWIKLSAEYGNPLAQYNLALNYLGEIISPYIAVDIEHGIKLLEEAAKGGHNSAKELLKELKDRDKMR